MAKEQSTKAPTVQPAAPVAGPLPAAPVSVEKAKSDRYRVKGPGGLFANGRSHVAGEVVHLSDSDALSVLDAIEPV
jgi:hypothetical protein